MSTPYGPIGPGDMNQPVVNEDRAKLANARTSGPMSFAHLSDGLHPIGEDGWPIEDELRELDEDVQNALSLLQGGEVIDIEPESVVESPRES